MMILRIRLNNCGSIWLRLDLFELKCHKPMFQVKILRKIYFKANIRIWLYQSCIYDGISFQIQKHILGSYIIVVSLEMFEECSCFDPSTKWLDELHLTSRKVSVTAMILSLCSATCNFQLSCCCAKIAKLLLLASQLHGQSWSLVYNETNLEQVSRKLVALLLLG